MYFSPGENEELEVVSKTHGKFIATTKYEPGRWGEFICWVNKKTGEEIKPDKETDVYRKHESRKWKYENWGSFKTAPSWVKFLWGVWRIRQEGDTDTLYVEDLQGFNKLCCLHPGDTLYLGDEVDEWGNLYPKPYVKNNINNIKLLQFPDTAYNLNIGNKLLYMDKGFLCVYQCVEKGKKNVTIENIDNFKRIKIKINEPVFIINSGIKIL
jgi:hypothetical protein